MRLIDEVSVVLFSRLFYVWWFNRTLSIHTYLVGGFCNLNLPNFKMVHVVIYQANKKKQKSLSDSWQECPLTKAFALLAPFLKQTNNSLTTKCTFPLYRDLPGGMVQCSNHHCSTFKLAFSASESNLIMGRIKFMQSCCLKCILPLLLSVTISKMSHNFLGLNQLCLRNVLYYIVRVIVTSKQVWTLIIHLQFSARFNVVIPQIIPFDWKATEKLPFQN